MYNKGFYKFKTKTPKVENIISKRDYKRNNQNILLQLRLSSNPRLGWKINFFH